jgi:hypothetical protein
MPAGGAVASVGASWTSLRRVSVVGREFDLGELSERGVDRAGLLLRFGHRDPLVVVLDAETGELVKVPGLPGGEVRKASLSADGRHVLLLLPRGANPGDRETGDHCVHSLATGKQRWQAAEDRGWTWGDVEAALSPRGDRIATLTFAAEDPHDDESWYAAVDVIDVDTGERRRLWSRPDAGSSAESTVGWSRDGRLVAVTYLASGDPYDNAAYVVLDSADGTVLEHCTDGESRTLMSTNGTWTEAGELVSSRDWEVFLTTFGDGGSTRCVGAGGGRGAHALLGDRLLDSQMHTDSTALELVTTDLDGGDLQVLFRFVPLMTAADVEVAAGWSGAT